MAAWCALAPIGLLLALWIAPLAAGTRTLYLRDVLNTHLPMKAAHAALLRAGDYLPLIDPQRAGGQPLLGNPNAVPLYPDNVLYLLGPVLWALNAHLWLHLLVAFGAMFALGRAFALGRGAALAAAVAYGFSGYALSTLNFYNLMAAMALAPALVAAAVHCRRRAGALRPAAALGAIWALLLLGGEPLLGALALVLAGLAWIVVGGEAPWRRALLPPALGLALGTLVAAPQLVEAFRILPQSMRGFRGYAADAGRSGSLDPRQALDWILPFAYGRPDLVRGSSLWGQAFYGGTPPIYFSLYPGSLAFALLALSGRGWRRGSDAFASARRWAWLAALLGIGLALGAWNPLARPLFALGWMRYPVKSLLLAAPALALLVGLGWQRAASLVAARRRLGRLLLGMAVFWAGAWLTLTLFPGACAALLRRLVPARLDDAFVAGERLRWAGTCFLVLLVAMALVAVERLTRARRRRWATGLLLGAHAAGQFLLLLPLIGTDASARYHAPAELLAAVPASSRIVHGDVLDLFGPSQLGAQRFERDQMRYVEHRAFAWLYPASGTLAGVRYELDTSPEGLDSYVASAAQRAVEQLPDAARVWLLRAWGVDRLLLARPLEAGAEALVEAPQHVPSDGGEILVYALREPAPSPRYVGRVVPAADMRVALAQMLRQDFDARQTAIVAGNGPVEEGGQGTARLIAESNERLEIAVDAATAGLVVVERAHLPLYRATVDGVPAPIEIANLYRLGVRVAAGAHRLIVETDRRPTHRALGAMAVGLLGLVGLVWRGRGERAKR